MVIDFIQVYLSMKDMIYEFLYNLIYIELNFPWCNDLRKIVSECDT